MYGQKNGAVALQTWINDEDIWKDFSAGVTGATAKGRPTLQELNMSANRFVDLQADVSGSLYVPKNESVEDCEGYWLNHYHNYASSNYGMYINFNGKIYSNEDASGIYYTVRPIICLPSELTGTVGETVHIVKSN